MPTRRNRTLLVVALSFLVPSPSALAQDVPSPGADVPPLYDDLGDHHYDISTAEPPDQRVEIW